MKLVIFALSACAVFGQDVSRVFPFHHTEGAQNFKEVATVIRTIAELSQVSVDGVAKTMSLSGPEGKVQIAEWLLKELDRTAAPDSVTKEFQVSDNDVVRVLYLPNTATIQQFQEVATAVRTVTEIPRIFTYNAPRAMVARGTADQIAGAAWMVQELDQPAGAKRTDPPEYHMIDPRKLGFTAVRVFYVPYTTTVQQFQEVATLVRTIGEIRQVFTYNEPKALTVRGTEDQVALAGWLVKELGKPVTAGTASSAYEYPDVNHDGQNFVRVFYVKDAPTVQTFQRVVTQIRTAAKIRRVFTYNASMAMAVRGTAEQLAMAEQILKDRQIASK